jgi:peptidyl-prolyl cis-trans isomerase A (cyclophilin A)
MEMRKALSLAKLFGLCTGLLLTIVAGFASHAGTLVQFRTTLGDFDVELFDADKPVTVQNFVRYIQANSYKDSIMHRVVTNFIIQGGAIYVANRNTSSNTLVYIPTFPPITNEFKVGTFRSNTYGTIAMAKTSDPNSATSQFFFNLTNNAPLLDDTNNSGGFTVFGHVIAGTNVLNRFKIGPTNTAVKKVNLGGVLAELPVLYAANPTDVQYSDLIYVDISLLNVQITLLTNGARDISWKSVSNRLNVVEFTTNFPPTWQTLTTTNGNGGTIKITDASADIPSRFYRVRVSY